ncbi:hypothetical protein KAU11_08825, partial [Candidatus Babeliales bacterium]|nr:hypothetical protein [Candidatus Babeliales bacterium]
NIKDSVLRLLNVEAPPLSDEQVIHIEDILGAPVASKHNQHAIVMIVGKTGEGKSRAALFIGYRVAVYLAKQLGGHWKDYFNSENVAVMTTEEVIRVMKANSPKKVIILDDIGAAWNSRDWNSKGNKILNRIIMTFRNKNNLLILTLPDSFILDKVPRNLLHFHIEMFKQEFDQGFSIYKLFRVLRRYRTGKTYFVHPRLNGVKFVAGAVDDSEIPRELIDEYEIRRNAIQEVAEAKDMDDFERLAAELANDEEEEKQNDRVKDVKKIQQENHVMEFAQYLNDGKSGRDAHKLVKLNHKDEEVVSRITLSKKAKKQNLVLVC